MAGFFNNADEPGFYAPGFSGIQGGPTLAWPDKATEQKLAVARVQIKTGWPPIRRRVRLRSATRRQRSHRSWRSREWTS